MKSSTKVFITFGVLVVLVAGLYFFTDWFSKTTGYALGEDQKISLAQCLAGKNTVIYTSETCPHCREQKELFGEQAFGYIENVVCDGSGKCSNLIGVPAWKIEGEIHYGKKELHELIEISGCSV